MTDQWWSPERRTHVFLDPATDQCSRCGKTRKEIEDKAPAECRVRFGIVASHEGKVLR